jgi:TRAP-type mannitol/chloroaromatic compound transport system permease small subunit
MIGLEFFLRIVDSISMWSGKLFSFLVWPMILVIACEIIARYLFNFPTVWASETVTYLCGIYAVVGGAYTLRFRGHVNVDIIYARLSTRKKATVDLVTSLLFFVFFGVLLWTGFELGWESIEIWETSGTAWSPPIYPVKLIIPLSAALILLQGVADFIRNLRRALTGEEEG